MCNMQSSSHCIRISYSSQGNLNARDFCEAQTFNRQVHRLRIIRICCQRHLEDSYTLANTTAKNMPMRKRFFSRKSIACERFRLRSFAGCKLADRCLRSLGIRRKAMGHFLFSQPGVGYEVRVHISELVQVVREPCHCAAVSQHAQK